MSFEAKYPGRCGDCGEHIEPGDRVRFEDDAVVHEECDGKVSVEDAPLDVCPTCWLIRPCECEAS